MPLRCARSQMWEPRHRSNCIRKDQFCAWSWHIHALEMATKALKWLRLCFPNPALTSAETYLLVSHLPSYYMGLLPPRPPVLLPILIHLSEIDFSHCPMFSIYPPPYTPTHAHPTVYTVQIPPFGIQMIATPFSSFLSSILMWTSFDSSPCGSLSWSLCHFSLTLWLLLIFYKCT
jgi:hypothetical protein